MGKNFNRLKKVIQMPNLCEKMLNITNHQRNVYQDYNEISLYFRMVIIKRKRQQVKRI